MIEDRESKIQARGSIRWFAIFDLLSSIVYLLISILPPKPATRFELVSAAYETAALPIELRRHLSAGASLRDTALHLQSAMVREHESGVSKTRPPHSIVATERI